MKHLFIGTMLLGAVILSSCNGSVKEENKRLKAQNEILTRCIAKFLNKPIPPIPPKMALVDSLVAIDDVHVMERLIDNMEGSTVIQIPTSWTLESAELMDMLTHSDKDGNFAQGLHAYAIVENGSLKFALIPYTTTGVTGEVNDIVDEFKAYNYSHMCPPNQHCAKNTSAFGAEYTTYTFNKQ